jgi:hypothetical protein
VTVTVTAPAAERPVTLTELRKLIRQLAAKGEGEDTTLGQVIELTELKRTLDQELKNVKAEIGPREEALLGEFADLGVTSMRHEQTGKLAYVRRQIWARPAVEDRAEACDALRQAGLGDYVAESFNVQSLSAYFREQVKEREGNGEAVTSLDELLQDGLRGVIELTEDHQIGVRS